MKQIWFEEIYLMDKKISSLSEFFGKQTKLRRLDISNNAFEKVPAALFALVGQKLDWLNLNGNPFTRTPKGKKLTWLAETKGQIRKLLKDAQEAELMD